MTAQYSRSGSSSVRFEPIGMIRTTFFTRYMHVHITHARTLLRVTRWSNPPFCTQSEQYQARLRGQDRRKRVVRGETERVETVDGVARMAAWGGRVGGRVGWSGRRSRKVSPEINRPPFPGQLYSLSLSALSSSLSSLSLSLRSLPLSALSLPLLSPSLSLSLLSHCSLSLEGRNAELL